MGRTPWGLALLVLLAAAWTVAARTLVIAAPPGGVTAISVCGSGGKSSESCPAGTFDTEEKVFALDGVPLNEDNSLPNAVDEHSSVFPPNALGSNSDYLFFVASGTAPRHTMTTALVHDPVDIGVVVLSGGTGPTNGRWAMKFADGYGSVYNTDHTAHTGQVLMAPMGQGNCPAAPDAKDTTWDLNYAAPGSVVADPTGPSGSLLMFYEGTNDCAQSVGGAHIALGIATSHNYGVDWPTYAPTASFTFAPLPYQNVRQGPNIPVGTGAFDSAVCIGNTVLASGDCGYAKPSPGYGRYPALGAPPGPDGRVSQPAAFVDTVRAGTPPYLYSVQVYNPPAPLPDGRPADLTIARAPLNSSITPLAFETWNGGACPSCWVGPAAGNSENNQQEYQILKDVDGDFTHCEDKSQFRSSPGLSYVPGTKQYLLTFVCRSLGDPALWPTETNPQKGAAWFFSTSYDLSDPNEWTTPTEILGTWAVFDASSGSADNQSFYDGWYPSFMSIRREQGWLSSRGYAFYLWGCEGGGCGGRHFTSRRFFIQTTDNLYSRPPVATITGLLHGTSGTGTVLLEFRSNEPGSAFECAINDDVFTHCVSGVSIALRRGLNAVSVRAVNPFGTIGRVAIAHAVY